MPPNPAASRLLSPRMLDVVRLQCQGKTSHQIARELKISYFTTRNYISKIYTRLGVSNKTEAVVTVIRLGLVEIDQ